MKQKIFSLLVILGIIIFCMKEVDARIEVTLFNVFHNIKQFNTSEYNQWGHHDFGPQETGGWYGPKIPIGDRIKNIIITKNWKQLLYESDGFWCSEMGRSSDTVVSSSATESYNITFGE